MPFFKLLSTDQGGENLWIEIVQRSGIDPHDLVVRDMELLVSIIEDVLQSSENVSQMSLTLAYLANHRKQNASRREAAMRAVTSLAFVAPTEATPVFLKKVKVFLDSGPLKKLGTYEYGVWVTPPGFTFVDGAQTLETFISSVNNVFSSSFLQRRS
jgi:hypothetical protein